MKRIFTCPAFNSLTGLVFFCLIALCAMPSLSLSADNTIEKQLSSADDLFLKGQYSEAIKGYGNILKSSELIPEMKSLILIRTAYAQKASGKKAGCLKTLGQLKSLEYLPEHHRLIVTELEAEIAGKPNPSLSRTPKPSFDKVAVTIYFSSSASSTGADGSINKPFPTVALALEKARILRQQKSLQAGAVVIALTDPVYQVKEPVE